MFYVLLDADCVDAMNYCEVGVARRIEADCAIVHNIFESVYRRMKLTILFKTSLLK